MVWLCMVWENIHLKLLWNFHEDLICFGCFREDIQLVWIGKVWYGMVWFGLVWDNIQLKLLWNFHQDPTCFGCFREDLQLVYFGKVCYCLVWYLFLEILWHLKIDHLTHLSKENSRLLFLLVLDDDRATTYLSLSSKKNAVDLHFFVFFS